MKRIFFLKGRKKILKKTKQVMHAECEGMQRVFQGEVTVDKTMFMLYIQHDAYQFLG